MILLLILGIDTPFPIVSKLETPFTYKSFHSLSDDPKSIVLSSLGIKLELKIY